MVWPSTRQARFASGWRWFRANMVPPEHVRTLIRGADRLILDVADGQVIRSLVAIKADGVGPVAEAERAAMRSAAGEVAGLARRGSAVEARLGPQSSSSMLPPPGGLSFHLPRLRAHQQIQTSTASPKWSELTETIVTSTTQPRLPQDHTTTPHTHTSSGTHPLSLTMSSSTSQMTTSVSNTSLTDSTPLPYSTSPPPGLADCPYVLLAEFDIDEGSVIRHQYPGPTGADQQ